MKIPTNSLPDRKPKRPRGNPAAQRYNRYKKRLEAIDFTPMTAHTLAGILLYLADGTAERREIVLRTFGELANGDA